MITDPILDLIPINICMGCHNVYDIAIEECHYCNNSNMKPYVMLKTVHAWQDAIKKELFSIADDLYFERIMKVQACDRLTVLKEQLERKEE